MGKLYLHTAGSRPQTSAQEALSLPLGAALECFVLDPANLKHLDALGLHHPDALSLKCSSVLVVSVVVGD